jgi:long-chain acyl-CoA synthetase
VKWRRNLLEQRSNSNLGNFYLRNSNPQDIAIVYEAQPVSYGELDKQICQYAYYLLSLGVKQGDTVALSCYNTPQFIYSYFAITKIGAIVVPLNLMLTMEEILYILQNSHANTLIIHEKIAKKLNLNLDVVKKQLQMKNIMVLNQETSQQIDNAAAVNLPVVEPDSISTLVYTSGTTGKPKGAKLTHYNLLQNAYSCEVALGSQQQDKFLCVLPMFHAFGFTVCVLLPLYIGSTIVIFDSFHPKEVIEAFLKRQTTIFVGVPSMYIVLAQALKNIETVIPMRIAVSGGAPLPVEILKLFNEQYKIPLIEGYGLTEASPAVSFNPLDGEKKAGSVGLPLINIHVKIVNEQGQEQPTGQPGELLVKGPNVMQGYFEENAETEKTIVDGWLHTGDIAFMDEDGYIFIVDRKKELIITRGFNVYPREVEEAIYSHPSVLETAVIGAADPTRGEIVKAFVVLKDGEQLDKKELTDFLHKKLANYKVPRIVEFASNLPKNAAGKILKKQLK